MTLMIDGRKVEAEDGTTILDAALKAKIHIPTLCYLPEVQAIGPRRVCLVEVEGNKVLQASCIAPASDGMVVYTNTERVRKARKFLWRCSFLTIPLNVLPVQKIFIANSKISHQNYRLGSKVSR